LLHRVHSDWLVPFITMMVAYPLMSLDQIGIELQNPFAKTNLSHLPLGDISATIEMNLLGLLHAKQATQARVPAELHRRMVSLGPASATSERVDLASSPQSPT
jgi:predicted membrane chloride channel (bestrophin family)